MTDSITIQLTVTGVDGSPRVPLEINQNVSCAALRKLASEKTQIPLDKLRLIFRGRLVGSDESKEAVPEFKIEEGSVLHCMGKPAAAKAEPATATTSASAPSPAVNNSTAASATVRVGMNTGAANASAVQQDSLQQCLQRLRSGNSHADYLTGVTTLEKILSNIMNNPMEEKYRKMKQNNAAFQRRLGGLTGGDAVMKAAGFSVEDGVYVLTPSPEAWPKLTETKAAVDRAANEARAIANQTAPAPAAAPSLGGFPSDMAGNAAQQQMVANMMSNPQQLQAMLQDPMVQNMMRNHPDVANYPMGQQLLEQLSSNPEMLNMISQTMRDPARMQQMQQMMQSRGLGNMPNQNQAPAGSGSTQQGQPSVASDQQVTEEEMIAEAIRRSLQDG